MLCMCVSHTLDKKRPVKEGNVMNLEQGSGTLLMVPKMSVKYDNFIFGWTTPLTL